MAESLEVQETVDDGLNQADGVEEPNQPFAESLEAQETVDDGLNQATDDFPMQNSDDETADGPELPLNYLHKWRTMV